jgi:anti-anti-sigma factor
MSIKKYCKDEVVILEVDSDLIGHRARVFHEFCRELVAQGVNQLILNLQQVNSIDSLGTGYICWLIEKGVEVRLVNVSHNVDLFLKCHTPQLLEHVCLSEHKAIKHIHEDILSTREIDWVEKRKFRRKSIRFPVIFNRLEAAPRDEKVEGVALNLSGGGMLLSLQADSPLSHLWKWLSLQLFIPEFFSPICVQGQLTRSSVEGEKWKMGIKFTQIDGQDRNRIVDCIYNNVI